MTYGGSDTMWVITMFDLPTTTSDERKQYTKFRKFLLDDGFEMMQYSVYMRHSASDENAAVHIQRIKDRLPDDGEVRIIKITDSQFGKIEVFFGPKAKAIEKAPEQLSLF